MLRSSNRIVPRRNELPLNSMAGSGINLAVAEGRCAGSVVPYRGRSVLCSGQAEQSASAKPGRNASPPKLRRVLHYLKCASQSADLCEDFLNENTTHPGWNLGSVCVSGGPYRRARWPWQRLHNGHHRLRQQRRLLPCRLRCQQRQRLLAELRQRRPRQERDLRSSGQLSADLQRCRCLHGRRHDGQRGELQCCLQPQPDHKLRPARWLLSRWLQQCQ